MGRTEVMRALVVEDEPAICEICSRSLNTLGFDVDTAHNGNTALDRLDRMDYTLILIDIRIPVMDGSELYQFIKEKHPNLVDRVIFTTGDVLDKNTRSFLGQVDKPLLLKPFTPDELQTIARETLRQLG